MALKRFPLEKYASVELNHVIFSRTGNVISQTPLGEDFTVEAPCENGMWVCADRSKGVIAAIESTDEPIGIVYTAEKEYDREHYGLKEFGRKVAGDYPRVGIFEIGDVITTNCLQYDDGEYTSEEALYEALAAFETAPVYVVPVVGSAVPQLTATKPAAGTTYAKVCKFYTVPNGERGVKYQIVKA